MAKLKRDERVCPYCAETIKASAIKCRFCQSEVTPVVEPETAPVAAPVAKKAPAAKTAVKKAPAKKVAETKVEPVVEKVAEQRAPLYKNLTVILAALVALAAIAVGTLWWRAEQSSAATAPNGSLVGEDARTEVLISAADLTQRTLSYDYKTLSNDMETAQARMTKSFRKEYDATMTQVRDNTVTNKIVQQAVVMSSSIISATEHKAKVLVFVNQTTTAGIGKDAKQQLIRSSVVIDLTRGDGDWAISKLKLLG